MEKQEYTKGLNEATSIESLPEYDPKHWGVAEQIELNNIINDPKVIDAMKKAEKQSQDEMEALLSDPEVMANFNIEIDSLLDELDCELEAA